MGEVYQATDAKLGRRVATKTLPEAFTHVNELVDRTTPPAIHSQYPGDFL
jgi:hypothetical protein